MTNTSCYDCIFATWNGRTQTGCKFDRIDKLEDNGAEILGKDDGEKQYFLIIGRFCNACRNHEWGDKHRRREWKSIVEKQIEIPIDVIIFVKPNHAFCETLFTLDSLYNQNIKPKSILIAIDSPSESAGEISSFYTSDLIYDLKNRDGIPWRVETLSTSDAIKLCKSTYITSCNAGYIFPADFIFNLNKAINVDMKRFVVILPDDNGNRPVWMKLAGNTHNEIIEKAKKSNIEYEHMIFTLEDLTRE